MNPALVLMSTIQIASTENQFIQALLETGPFAQVILAIILLFSVFSWSVIFYKLWQFHKIVRCNNQFLYEFNRLGGDFGALSQLAQRLHEGTVPTLFLESYQELRAVGIIREQQLLFERTHLGLVQKRMERVIGQLLVSLESRLIFLATTANACPFLGLLGTVWGVLGTFMTMSTLETALTLQLIGPGISEALTTTIFGLGAAIPAVIAYNHLVNRVAVFRMEMEDFALRLLAILEKNILARSAPDSISRKTREAKKEPELLLSEQVTIL